MKKIYNIPYILVERYTVEDILTTSPTETDDFGESPNWDD